MSSLSRTRWTAARTGSEFETPLVPCHHLVVHTRPRTSDIPWHHERTYTSHPSSDFVLNDAPKQNLLRTLTELNGKSGSPEPDLRLLLTTVKEARVSNINAYRLLRSLLKDMNIAAMSRKQSWRRVLRLTRGITA